VNLNAFFCIYLVIAFKQNKGQFGPQLQGKTHGGGPEHRQAVDINIIIKEADCKYNDRIHVAQDKAPTT
jgi:hypothetical protein